MPSPAAATCARSSLPQDAPMALVLSGGGAKGAYEAGVAAAFAERGLPIRLVAGSSAGALNAAMIASGRADQLETMWRSVHAAAAPGRCPPVEVAGTPLVDGGLTGRAPVLEALEADASVGRAVVVMSYAPTERGASPSTMRRALEESFELMMIQQIRRDTELA